MLLCHSKVINHILAQSAAFLLLLTNCYFSLQRSSGQPRSRADVVAKTGTVEVERHTTSHPQCPCLGLPRSGPCSSSPSSVERCSSPFAPAPSGPLTMSLSIVSSTSSTVVLPDERSVVECLFFMSSTVCAQEMRPETLRHSLKGPSTNLCLKFS
jgi:hypothetical protein